MMTMQRDNDLSPSEGCTRHCGTWESIPYGGLWGPQVMWPQPLALIPTPVSTLLPHSLPRVCSCFVAGSAHMLLLCQKSLSLHMFPFSHCHLS